MNWGEVLSVVVVGMVVVFLALIILIIAVKIMGFIFQIFGGAKKNKVTAKETNEPAKNTATPAMDATPSDGIPGDVVAAITAAIACVLSSEGNNKPFTVKSIKRVREARNPWNMAGIVENTRPF